MVAKFLFLTRDNSIINKLERKIIESNNKSIRMKLRHSKEIKEQYPSPFFNIYDFHTITVQLMEYDPDFILYIPYCSQSQICGKDDELLRISNYDLYHHLLEINDIIRSKLILILPPINPKSEIEHSVNYLTDLEELAKMGPNSILVQLIKDQTNNNNNNTLPSLENLITELTTTSSGYLQISIELVG